MTLKQITAVKVGDKYDIVVFGLTAEGEAYALHTHAGDLQKGEWVKLSTKVKSS